MPGIDSAQVGSARTILVLGGARSGKSAWAESVLSDHPGRRIYIATGEAGDDEMARRIAQHRARRGSAWETLETPLDLAAALRANDAPGTAFLIDCLTLWLSNLMAAGRDVAAGTAGLITTLGTIEGRCVLVANEVGLGIVPANALARAFRDHAGRMNQQIAAAVDHVVLVTAGLPLTLKS